MFLALVKNPPWKTWSEAPRSKIAFPECPTEIRATELERLQMAGLGRDAHCEEKANDTRSVEEVIAAEPQKDEDGEPTTDIHLFNLVDRPPEDALAILARAPIARICRRCVDSAPLLFLRTNGRAIPELVRISRDPSWEDVDLLDRLRGIVTPLVVPELLLGITSDNDDWRERAARHLRRFAKELAPTISALAAGADPSPLGFVEKKQEREEGEEPKMSLAWRARYALSILARTGHEDAIDEKARVWAEMPPILSGTIPYDAPKLPKRIVLEGKRLGADETTNLLAILANIDWQYGARDGATLRSELDEASRKAIADSLVRRFVREDWFSDRWIVKVAVAIAPERVAAIRSVLQKKKGRSMRQRWKEQLAVQAMCDAAVFHPDLREQMFAAIGSIALDPVKQRRHLNRTANDALREVAEQLGLNPDTLDDRTIPSLGLDAKGGLMLDWGGRPIEARMTSSLELVFVVDGEKKPSPPAPTKGANKRKLARAKKEVERLRKEGRVLVLGLTDRIERWMHDRQRWDRDEFVRHVVGHPVLRAIAQGFVWGSFDGPFESNVVQTFRIAEDGTFADESDAQIDPKGRIGMVHPGEIPDVLRQRWGNILADYEIVSIVPQLELKTLSEAQKKSDTLEHLQPPDSYYADRVRMPGWTKTSYWGWDDARAVWERELGRFFVTIVYTRKPALFAKVRRIDAFKKQWLPWSEVDPYAAHETLADLDAFAVAISKARRRS